jgi:AbrB family looped-hinge helix DNA binding protein
MAHTERQITVGDRGRLVLPAALRARLGFLPGSRVLISAEPDGSLRLRPYRAIAEQNRGLWADIAPADVSMVDELIAGRRAEAEREGDD